MAKTVANADVALDSASSLPQRVTAELFGTFLLVAAVVGTALFTAPSAGILPIALAVGLAVTVGAYSVGHISGGHFNPAVTLGAAAAGRFAWKDAPYYILAQVIGGALGTTFIFVLASNGPTGLLASVQGAGFASNGFGDHSGGGFGLVAVIVAEVVLTAVFLYVILGVTDRRAPSGFAPLAIGLTLVVIHLIAIPVSGASVNPARSIASAIYGGPDAMLQLWVFIAAPIVGALIAGVSYGRLFDRSTKA
ncbi:MAG: aquaporin [Rhodoglobus sp.]